MECVGRREGWKRRNVNGRGDVKGWEWGMEGIKGKEMERGEV